MHRRKAQVIMDVPDSYFAAGDKDLLYRAFYNIVINGLQAMPDGGHIKITAHLTEQLPETAANRADRKGEWICLEFLDSGPGFDDKTKNNILDPFFTTKDGGTGLGLPIVQSIISGHGGVMELENGQAGGALIKIWLPAAKAAGAEKDER